jgi:hypothetical protein
VTKLFRLLVAVDQVFNVLFGGWPDETLSARCWRCRDSQPYAALRAVIDGLFFWQNEHCKQSYESERLRMQSPPEERI